MLTVRRRKKFEQTEFIRAPETTTSYVSSEKLINNRLYFNNFKNLKGSNKFLKETIGSESVNRIGLVSAILYTSMVPYTSEKNMHETTFSPALPEIKIKTVTEKTVKNTPKKTVGTTKTPWWRYSAPRSTRKWPRYVVASTRTYTTSKPSVIDFDWRKLDQICSARERNHVKPMFTTDFEIMTSSPYLVRTDSQVMSLAPTVNDDTACYGFFGPGFVVGVLLGKNFIILKNF